MHLVSSGQTKTTISLRDRVSRFFHHLTAKRNGEVRVLRGEESRIGSAVQGVCWSGGKNWSGWEGALVVPASHQNNASLRWLLQHRPNCKYRDKHPTRDTRPQLLRGYGAIALPLTGSGLSNCRCGCCCHDQVTRSPDQLGSHSLALSITSSGVLNHTPWTPPHTSHITHGPRNSRKMT